MEFEKVQEIKEKLTYGDYRTLADIVGCKKVTVASHFQGARNHNSPTGKRITEAALKLIQSREQIANEMKSEESHV